VCACWPGWRFRNADTSDTVGKPVTGPGIDRAWCFRTTRSFPGLTLTKNVVLAIGKAHPQLERKERRELAEEYLELVTGLADAHGKYPQELSGGMASVGPIARALPWARPCC